jgi:hypothetical protein
MVDALKGFDMHEADEHAIWIGVVVAIADFPYSNFTHKETQGTHLPVK